MGVPQAAQKSRSAIEEEANAAGLPRIQEKCSCGMSANEANGAPVAFWHIRQWQMLTRTGGDDTAKRSAPHWQPPVRRGFASDAMSIHPLISFGQDRQPVAAGKDKVLHAGVAQRGFLLARASRQIDMCCAGGLKGLRGCGSLF